MLAALAEEFPRVDASLIEMLLEDQGGDVADVRFSLRVRAAKTGTGALDEAMMRTPIFCVGTRRLTFL